MLQDLPDIFIDNMLSILDDKTIINIALSCKSIYTNFTYVIDNRKEIKEIALKNGERYKKIISFYEKTMKNEAQDDEKYIEDMHEWYSSLKKDDILYNVFFNKKEIIDNEIRYVCFNKLWISYYKFDFIHEIIANKEYIFYTEKDIISTTSPFSILIPPRTDILI
jgi:hypothetical protein